MKEINRTLRWRGKFIEVNQIEYEDKDGNIREWERVSRKGDQEAVTIIAWLRVSKKLIVIKQYRPPIDAYEIGFPAGLIDEGERPERMCDPRTQRGNGIHWYTETRDDSNCKFCWVDQ